MPPAQNDLYFFCMCVFRSPAVMGVTGIQGISGVIVVDSSGTGLSLSLPKVIMVSHSTIMAYRIMQFCRRYKHGMLNEIYHPKL
jgi:TRAP-type C4-dicarboxylate transport system permease small subunit